MPCQNLIFHTHVKKTKVSTLLPRSLQFNLQLEWFKFWQVMWPCNAALWSLKQVFSWFINPLNLFQGTTHIALQKWTSVYSSGIFVTISNIKRYLHHAKNNFSSDIIHFLWLKDKLNSHRWWQWKHLVMYHWYLLTLIEHHWLQPSILLFSLKEMMPSSILW